VARPKQIQPFFIIVTDSDKKTFNVLGPMTDDTQITNQVARCQEQGRRVNCHTAGPGRSREQVIADYQRQYDFTYADERIAA
jgi:hypothetical protein